MAAPQLATEGSYKSPKKRWLLIYGPHEQRAKGSIRLGKNHALGRGATGDHAQTRFDWKVCRDAANRRLGFGRDLVLGLPRSVPMGQEKPAGRLDLLLEFLVGFDSVGVGVAKGLGLGK